jgi:DNA-binding response OmpR family regulator
VFARGAPDAVVLDLMLPDTNGFKVCEELRRSTRSCRSSCSRHARQEVDKIRGLDAGADDYMTKPFSVGELIARMRAIFRRAQRPTNRHRRRS